MLLIQMKVKTKKGTWKHKTNDASPLNTSGDQGLEGWVPAERTSSINLPTLTVDREQNKSVKVNITLLISKPQQKATICMTKYH